MPSVVYGFCTRASPKGVFRLDSPQPGRNQPPGRKQAAPFMAKSCISPPAPTFPENPDYLLPRKQASLRLVSVPGWRWVSEKEGGVLGGGARGC